MLLRVLDDGLQVHRLTTPEEAAAFRDRFAAAYRDIFARPPYQEVHTLADAAHRWDVLTAAEPSVVLVVVDGEELVAFAIAVPLQIVGSVAREIAGLVPPRHTMYLAELGVAPGRSRKRFARLLAHIRLKLINETRYSHVVLRAPQDVEDTIQMYRELGFTDMGVSMQVRHPRTDGTVQADTRVFMSRVRSQVEVDDEDLTDADI